MEKQLQKNCLELQQEIKDLEKQRIEIEGKRTTNQENQPRESKANNLKNPHSQG